MGAADFRRTPLGLGIAEVNGLHLDAGRDVRIGIDRGRGPHVGIEYAAPFNLHIAHIGLLRLGASSQDEHEQSYHKR